MSIDTHPVVRTNGSPTSPPAAAPAPRPRVFAHPRPAAPAFAAPAFAAPGASAPSEEERRVPGANCRIAMGYLD
ncbi:hypothetical protein [Kitasatospora mediocidica]|uniref:hypothetical protein n=1 Tax=Kitasatospora mediocidica TaxID=58352 RepID=UPI00056A0A3C|nr:hypothetical protein [Kitasatospora mediocidica]